MILDPPWPPLSAHTPPPLTAPSCNPRGVRFGLSGFACTKCALGNRAVLCWNRNRVRRRVTPPPPPLRDALEGKGPRRRFQKQLDRRLEEVAKAVGGGYCRLQMPLKLALGVRETMARHRLGALEGGRGSPPSNASLPPPPHPSQTPPLASVENRGKNYSLSRFVPSFVPKTLSSQIPPPPVLTQAPEGVTLHLSLCSTGLFVLRGQPTRSTRPVRNT